METILNMKVDGLIVVGVALLAGGILGWLSLLLIQDRIDKKDATIKGKDDEGVWR